MALSDFNINPTTGSGGSFATSVVVSPKRGNDTHSDKQANLNVNAGGSAKTLTLVQYGVPSITRQNAGNISSGGGVATYVVQTHYDFYFEGVPEWITISDLNGTISANTKITKEAAENNIYSMIVAPNDTTSARSTDSSFNFRNYRRDGATIETLYKTRIEITQNAGVPDAPRISVDTPTLEWDWDASGITKTINITSNIAWTASVVGNGFSIIGSSTGTNNGSIVVSADDRNGRASSGKVLASITIGNGEVSTNVSLSQTREPWEYLNGSTSVNPTGDTKQIEIFSDDYSFWYKQGSSVGGTNGFSTQYITMYYDGDAVNPQPTSEANAQPATSGKTYVFVWMYNDAVPKNDLFIVEYRGRDGVVREMYKNFDRFHQDYIPQVEDYIYVSPSAMTIDWWTTGNTNFSIDSNYNTSSLGFGWTYEAVGDTSDFEFEKIGSQLKVKPKNTNSGGALRSLSLSFSAGTASTTATAVQLRKPIINALTPVYTIPASGGTRDFMIISDYEWWIIDGFGTGYPSYTPSVGTSSNPNSPTSGTQITAIFSANTTGNDVPVLGNGYFRVRYNDREGTTRTDGGNSSGWKQLAGSDELVATQSNNFSNISSGGSQGQLYLSVKCATAPWGITSPEWAVFTPSTGAASDSFTQANLVVEPNDGVSRSGIVYVSAGNATQKSFAISQQAAYVPPEVGYVQVSPSSASVGSGASFNTPFDVSANTDWTISTPEWIKFSNWTGVGNEINGGTGSKRIYAHVSANTTTSPRSGTSVFSSATNSVNVVIGQAAGAEPEPQPSGTFDLDPAQISPASSSYDIYEVEAWNDTDEDYMVQYSDTWAKFYDGPDPRSANEVSVVPFGERMNLYLEVNSGHHGSITITFSGMESGDYITFYVNQP